MINFVIIIGATNSGKTSLAQSYESKGYKRVNFDSFYHQNRKRKSPHNFSLINHQILCYIIAEINRGNKIVYEGTQLLLPTLFQQIVNICNQNGIEAGFVFIDKSLEQLVLNLVNRWRSKAMSTRIRIEQIFLLFFSYVFFACIKYYFSRQINYYHYVSSKIVSNSIIKNKSYLIINEYL
ncbi:MAG: hypothetical protein KAR54_01535 [Candidatus Pacebacteria bacterium]|nr:hypothetical protein [Candidatus Paceibacterota bacterium]